MRLDARLTARDDADRLPRAHASTVGETSEPTRMATASAARKADRVAFHAGKRTSRRPRRRALGLHARLTIGFALAALVVSLSLTLATYVLARNNLLDQRESGAVTQALVNARLMRDILRSPQALPNQVVRDLRTESDGHALLNFRGSWFPSNVLRFNQDALPASLREATLAGQSGRQRFDVNGTPYIGVGVYAAELDAAYLEVFSMASLQRTLSYILTSLLVGSAIATVGAAAFGAYTSRRLLRPLLPASPARPASWRRATSTPASNPNPTPTSTVSSARSTTWPTPCRAASSGRPASPPT